MSFNGITKRATQSSVQEALSQVNKKVLLYQADNGVYPPTLGDVGITDQSGSPFYNYVSDTITSPAWYQLTVSSGINGSEKYSVSSTNSAVQAGDAPGVNLIPWDKSDNTTAPVLTTQGITIDTSVYRTSMASIRIPPNGTGKALRLNPISGTVGQVVRVSLWLKTDAAWNGTNGNSKIRFGANPSGAILSACTYEGVKVNWTFVTCAFTLSVANPSVLVTVGNDGTVGNIWLDDITVSVR